MTVISKGLFEKLNVASLMLIYIVAEFNKWAFVQRKDRVPKEED